MLAPILVGRDPFHVRGLWDEMFWRTQIVGRAGVATGSRMGAVDIALWDLMARSLDVPLWKLLGGTGAESIPALFHGRRLAVVLAGRHDRARCAACWPTGSTA